MLGFLFGKRRESQPEGGANRLALKRRARRLADEGYSAQEIAEALGVPLRTVQRWVSTDHVGGTGGGDPLAEARRRIAERAGQLALTMFESDPDLQARLAQDFLRSALGLGRVRAEDPTHDIERWAQRLERLANVVRPAPSPWTGALQELARALAPALPALLVAVAQQNMARPVQTVSLQPTPTPNGHPEPVPAAVSAPALAQAAGGQSGEDPLARPETAARAVWGALKEAGLTESARAWLPQATPATLRAVLRQAAAQAAPDQAKVWETLAGRDDTWLAEFLSRLQETAGENTGGAQ